MRCRPPGRRKSWVRGVAGVGGDSVCAVSTCMNAGREWGWVRACVCDSRVRIGLREEPEADHLRELDVLADREGVARRQDAQRLGVHGGPGPLRRGRRDGLHLGEVHLLAGADRLRHLDHDRLRHLDRLRLLRTGGRDLGHGGRNCRGVRVHVCVCVSGQTQLPYPTPNDTINKELKKKKEKSNTEHTRM